MTAHQLARTLLERPDLPVVINGWGSNEDFTFEVSEVSPPGECSYRGIGDTVVPRDRLGYPVPRPCITLCHLPL